MELLLTVSRDERGTLSAQIQRQLRDAVRAGTLHPGAPVPSTRELARQLGVSRKVVVDAYAQLAAEAYLTLRQGAQPRVAPGPFARHRATAAAGEQAAIRLDLRPARPDVSAFPRAAWARCLRDAVNEITVDDLGYGDPMGADDLRNALADYLGRARGVVADRDRIVVTSGYLQGLGMVCRLLRARGARRIACEDPCNVEEAQIAERAGLTPVRVRVDGSGLRIDELAATGADAVILTPAHQHPTGVVLAPGRRAALVGWLRETGATAIEDDYDAEYRYDRPAVGALQGLDRDHVVYAGTVSKVLAPALRLGWMVLPPALVDGVRADNQGVSRIEQLAFAHFLRRGHLDRHLRRMRARYRRRRDAMVEALAEHLPQATVRGVAAGLHVTVELPPSTDLPGIAAAARAYGIALSTLDDYATDAAGRPPTLVLGYSQTSEDRLRDGVRELAQVIGRPSERLRPRNSARTVPSSRVTVTS